MDARRRAVTITTVIVIGAAFLAGSAAQSPQPIPACGDEAMEQRTRAAMFGALDSAFQDHIAGLYSVWMRDGGAPVRAKSGIDRATAGYLHGYKSVEAWRLERC